MYEIPDLRRDCYFSPSHYHKETKNFTIGYNLKVVLTAMWRAVFPGFQEPASRIWNYYFVFLPTVWIKRCTDPCLPWVQVYSLFCASLPTATAIRVLLQQVLNRQVPCISRISVFLIQDFFSMLHDRTTRVPSLLFDQER